jgi:hypothetical protein
MSISVLVGYAVRRGTEKRGNYILRETSEKGVGLFATQDIKQGGHIFHVDLTGFQKYTLTESDRAVEGNPELDGDHANYVGSGKYVIKDTPDSYINHYSKLHAIILGGVLLPRDLKYIPRQQIRTSAFDNSKRPGYNGLDEYYSNSAPS